MFSRDCKNQEVNEYIRLQSRAHSFGGTDTVQNVTRRFWFLLQMCRFRAKRRLPSIISLWKDVLHLWNEQGYSGNRYTCFRDVWLAPRIENKPGPRGLDPRNCCNDCTPSLHVCTRLTSPVPLNPVPPCIQAWIPVPVHNAGRAPVHNVCCSAISAHISHRTVTRIQASN